MDHDAYARIFPQADEINRPYLDGLESGRLLLQRCDDDGTYRFPAAPVCPRCLSVASTWVEASGKGSVWSWITMHQPYFEAFRDELPYNVTFVELAEGPFMMTTVVNPGELEIGAPVRVRVGKMGGHSAPRFEVIPTD